MSDVQVKTCPWCGVTYPATLEHFYRAQSGKGLRSGCRPCHRERALRWHQTHRERANGTLKQWRESNQEHIREYERQYYSDPVNRQRRRKRMRQSYHRSPKDKLTRTLSVAVCYSLRGNKRNASWPRLLGYSVDDLRTHLERLFEPGMTWDNYGLHGWHIDHICPVAFFHFTSHSDLAFKECWALSNLRPLWAQDNWSKGAAWLGKTWQAGVPVAERRQSEYLSADVAAMGGAPGGPQG